MIEEQYCNFETSKLLKETGFPQTKNGYLFYNKYGQDYHLADGYIGNGYAKPSQAQAMRWLRETHKLSVRVSFIRAAYKNWFWDLLNTDTEDSFESDGFYISYEEAAEAGITEACKYIIQNNKSL